MREALERPGAGTVETEPHGPAVSVSTLLFSLEVIGVAVAARIVSVSVKENIATSTGQTHQPGLAAMICGLWTSGQRFEQLPDFGGRSKAMSSRRVGYPQKIGGRKAHSASQPPTRKRLYVILCLS